MSDTVSREKIAPLVIQKIQAVAHVPKPPQEKERLFEDLGMGPTVRRAMALPYSRISAQFGGNPVSQADAGDLKTVEESVTLVFKRANRN